MAVQISGNDITVPRDTTVTRNLTVGGVLTYEDVTNVDSVGLVTARSGIEIGARPGVGASISVDGNAIFSGITTATTLRSTTGIVTTLTATGLTVDSGTTNTVATFKSSDAGAVINLTDSAARASIEQNDTALKIIADTDASDADSKIQFQVDASTKMTITSAGYVGIGENSPDNILHVNSGSTNTAAKFESTDTEVAIQLTDTTGSAIIKARNDFRFDNSTGELARIESNGNVVLNHTDSITYNGHDPKLSIQGTTYSESTLAIISNTNENNGAYIFLGKQRSGSAGGGTLVQDGDLIGQFRYLAGDGTDLQSEVANITVSIDGTPGGNDVPGRITFATTNDGGNASTERMRVNKNGQVLIGTTSLLHSTNSTKAGIHVKGGGGGPYVLNIRNSRIVLFLPRLFSFPALSVSQEPMNKLV